MRLLNEFLNEHQVSRNRKKKLSHMHDLGYIARFIDKKVSPDGKKYIFLTEEGEKMLRIFIDHEDLELAEAVLLYQKKELQDRQALITFWNPQICFNDPETFTFDDVLEREYPMSRSTVNRQFRKMAREFPQGFADMEGKILNRDGLDYLEMILNPIGVTQYYLRKCRELDAYLEGFVVSSEL